MRIRLTVRWGLKSTMAWRVKAELLLVIVAVATFTNGKRTSLRFNEDTGGYEDLLVVISEDMSREECPQILENVKVRIFLNVHYCKKLKFI